MAQWFFEFTSGEIPALMQKGALSFLETWLGDHLKEMNIPYTSIQTFITPTRMGANLEGLPTTQEVTSAERRGPRTDAPENALQGFLTLTGKSKEELEIRETPKGSFYFDVYQTGGEKLTDLIPGILDSLISDFSWPKQMTWATGSRAWVRPLKAGYCVFDGQPLTFEINLSTPGHPHPLLLSFKNFTTGHRFLAPENLSPKTFDAYKNEMAKAWIMIDPKERAKVIQEQMENLCKAKGITFKPDARLMDEVVGLVEYPFSKLGEIQKEFMHLPPELLITSMRVHQRYFSTQNKDGSLAPYFITIANVPGCDGGKVLMEGNARVLKARLSDAAFFYETDLKAGFEPWLAKLDSVVFHTKLGTLAQRSKRISVIAPHVAAKADLPNLLDAIKFAKADLMSLMVGEFPELQGIMGSYYGKKAGLSTDVCQAIYDQYTPKGPEDQVPSHPLSQLLGIVDRLDTLLAFFAVDIKPTGSKDPFALRRAALALIRILEEGHEIALRPLMDALDPIYMDLKPINGYKDDLETFLMERLKIYWKDQGFAHDHINAVLSKGLDRPLVDIKARLSSLSNFLKDDRGNGPHLLAAYKRANNILLQASKDQNITFNGVIDAGIFESPCERDLSEGLQKAKPTVDKMLANRSYEDVMATLAGLRPILDTYFEGVMINVEDIKVRQNRLATLAYFRSLLEEVADFSKLEG